MVLYDVFKKCNINLRCLHRFNKQLSSKNSNLEVDRINLNESEFSLIDNKFYVNDKLISSYECDIEIPEISGIMSEAYTIEKKIHYVLGDSKLENLSEDIAFVYFRYKNRNAKLFVEIKYYPMQIWSPLIENICEFELL